MKKIKILIITDMLYGGGVEHLVYNLVMMWHTRYAITIMTKRHYNDFSNIFPSDVKYISSELNSINDRNIASRVFLKFANKFHSIWIESIVNKLNFDVALYMKEGWVMKDHPNILARNRYGWIHTDYKNNYYTDRIFGGKEEELFFLKQLDGTICVSNELANSLKNVIGDPGNLTVRYNPINVNDILYKSEEPVTDIFVNKVDEKILFVSVGYLRYQKGYDLLLEASHILEQEGYQFEVWVVGGYEAWGDEHIRIKSTKKRLNVKNVKFLGAQKNPYKYIKQGDWFLSSSIFEGYSLVSQEAAVLGIPLLLTRCSGVKELIGDDEYGLTMEPSVFGIYQGMKRVMDHPELHEHYRKKILERRQIISYEERIDAIEKLFQS